MGIVQLAKAGHAMPYVAENNFTTSIAGVSDYYMNTVISFQHYTDILKMLSY